MYLFLQVQVLLLGCQSVSQVLLGLALILLSSMCTKVRKAISLLPSVHLHLLAWGGNFSTEVGGVGAE